MFDGWGAWTPRKRRRWEAVRARGRRHFMLWDGAVCFGLVMPVLLNLVNFLLYHQPPTWHVVVIQAVMFPLIGYWSAGGTWDRMERSYQRYLERLPYAELYRLPTEE